MLPVDEFLPIMFDVHPNDEWKVAFENRTVVAYSATPLLIYPTHYTGDEGYISDTEDSTQIIVESKIGKPSNFNRFLLIYHFFVIDFKTEEADVDAQKKGDKENLVQSKSSTPNLLINTISIQSDGRTEL